MTAADIDTPAGRRGSGYLTEEHRRPRTSARRPSGLHHRSSRHDRGQLVPGCGPEEDGYLVERPVVDREVGGFDSARSFALRSSVLIVLSRFTAAATQAA